MSAGTKRRLAAIVSADAVGYSRLMGADEAGTLAAFRAHRAELIDPKIAQHGGRIVKTMGDGLLLEFASVVAATQCVIEIQQGMAERNRCIEAERRITFRIGVNLGDIIIEGEDILGDGVNVAARLQEIAEPGGVTVSDRVHEDVRDRLGFIFTDAGEKSLKNIARPVQVWRWLPDGPSAAVSAPAVPPPPASERPTVAVLPFESLSDDPEQQFFADGISEDIITALAKFHSLDVVGRNTSFAYRGRSVGLKQVSEALGVRYILEGSVRKAGKRVRITAQLIDGAADRHIWAERYDRELEDVFQVQDEIIEIIVATLAHKVDSEETERRAQLARTDRDAYDCYLTGREYFFARTKAANDEALALMERAIELDPNFARAHSFKAWLKAYRYRHGWSDEPEQCLNEALESALEALSLEPSDYDVHWRLAVVYLHRRQFDKARAEYQKARSLNPNHAGFLAEMASGLILLGRANEAIELVEQAKRINPQYPEWFQANLGWAYYQAGRPEEALEVLRVLNDPPAVFRIFLAATYARLDRIEEAQREVARIQEMEPGFGVGKLDFLPFEDDEYRAKLAGDLRKAGLPE
jgi:adenylate cyclase